MAEKAVGLNLNAIKHIATKKGMSVNSLIVEMSKSGVMGAGRLSKAVEIAEEMIKDKDCKLFFGLAGAMVPGGMRQIVVDMLKDKWIDALVVTGATLTHDLIEALGFRHYIGTHQIDDAKLEKAGYERMYDSFMPDKAYIELEKFCNKAFEEMPNEKIGIREFLQNLGKNIKDENSILGTCVKNKIPIFCPAIADSGIGLMAWQYLEDKKGRLNVDAFADLKEINEIAWEAKKKGVFYVGGGVPKNYIQQSMQFSPRPADYGLQITIDMPEFGGSSGAELREGISWHKMDEKGKFIDLYCDATIALPIISAALKERLG